MSIILYRLSTMRHMFVLLLSGKGSQSCLERDRGPELLAACLYPFLIVSAPRMTLLCTCVITLVCHAVARFIKNKGTSTECRGTKTKKHTLLTNDSCS